MNGNMPRSAIHSSFLNPEIAEAPRHLPLACLLDEEKVRNLMRIFSPWRESVAPAFQGRVRTLFYHA